MAIVSVDRQFTSRSADQDLKARVKTTSVYLVVVDSLDDGEQQVGNAQDPGGSSDKKKNIPRFGDIHPNIPGCYVVGVKPECSDDSPYIWFVYIDYDTMPVDFPQPNQIDSQGNTVPAQDARKQIPANPLARPPQWEVGSIDKQEPVREWIPVNQDGSIKYTTPAAWANAKDYRRGNYVTSNNNVYWCVFPGTSSAAPNGRGDANNLIIDGVLVWEYLSTTLQATTDPSFAIVQACLNSGQCPFDPPEMTQVSIPTVRVTKNIPMEVNFLLYCASLKNAVNKNVWKGLAARMAKLLSVTAKNMTENEVDFVQVTWEVGLDPDTWDARILDAGYGGIGSKSVANPLYPGTVGQPERITKKVFYEHRDGDGNILSGPVPMDGKGGPLDPDDDLVFLRGIPRQQKLIDFNTAIPW